MESINAKLAAGCISGQIEKNPFLHGLIIQAMIRIEKADRGVGVQGRQPSMSETVRTLLNDAALNLAVVGGNKLLAAELGQKVTPPKIRPSEMPNKHLPNPMLALMFPDQLQENLNIVDGWFPRTESCRSRRLICAIDATYLLRGFSQMKIGDQVGLIGGPWRPDDPAQAFIDLAKASKTDPKAPVMQEFLCWHPGSVRKECFSIASMPMSLAAPKSSEKETLTRAGNFDTWPYLIDLGGFLEGSRDVYNRFHVVCVII